MSNGALNWAKKQRVGGLACKAVLLLLADHANKSDEVWISFRSLAEEGDTDSRSIQRHVDSLIALGLVTKKSGDSARQNHYVLHRDVEISERARRPARNPTGVRSRRPDEPPAGCGHSDHTVKSGGPHEGVVTGTTGCGHSGSEVWSLGPHNPYRTQNQHSSSSPATEAKPTQPLGRPAAGLSKSDLADLNATAHTPGSWSLVGPWKNTHTIKYRPATYRELGKEVDELLKNNGDPTFISKALVEWDARGKCSPKFLRHCYDDVVHASRGGTPVGGQRGHLYAVNGTSALKRDPITGRVVER